MGWCLLGIGSLSSVGWAHLIVVRDQGETAPFAPYFAPLKVASTAKDRQPPNEAQRPIAVNTLLYPNTSELTPGKVATKKLTIAHLPAQPLFIVGPDQRSRQWLLTNATYLESIHAVGLVTNVQSASQVKQMEQGTPVRLIAANLQGLSEMLGVKHYPFLLYQQWVTQ